MRIQRLATGGLVLSLGLGLWACSSDDSSTTTGAGGGSSTTGGGSGSTGTGGSQGTGGSNGTGGQGTGGSSNGGSGGSSTAGSMGTGGSGMTDGGGTGDALPGTDSGGAIDGGPFALTSTAYTEGGMIPATNTCAMGDMSPPLAWTPGPAGTKSYTLILTDKTNSFVHWALWDIPPSTMSLPAGLPTGSPLASLGGAQQISFNGLKYAGPCPGASLHTYQFDLYAIDVDKLPGLSAGSMQPAVVTAAMAHKLKVASLSGMAKTK